MRTQEEVIEKLREFNDVIRGFPNPDLDMVENTAIAEALSWVLGTQSELVPES